MKKLLMLLMLSSLFTSFMVSYSGEVVRRLPAWQAWQKPTYPSKSDNNSYWNPGNKKCKNGFYGFDPNYVPGVDEAGKRIPPRNAVCIRNGYVWGGSTAK